MKRVLAILLTAIMTVFCIVVGLPKEQEELPQVIETKEVHILTDEELSRLYSYRPEVRNDTTINLTQQEAVLLMQIAKSESDGSIRGQLWVMCSIINRLEHGCGESIWEIVNQDNQYEVVQSGKYLKADIDFNSHYALALLEKGYNPTDAMYFEAKSNSDDSWHKKSLEYVGEAGGNIFYK